MEAKEMFDNALGISVEQKEMLDRLSEEFDCEVNITPPIVTEPDMIVCRRFFVKKNGKTRKLKSWTEEDLRKELQMVDGL